MLKPISISRISVPSIEEFYIEYVRKSRPVVITGLVNDWPALKRWNLNYFAENFGDVKSGVVRLKDGECDLNNYTGSRLDYIPIKDSIAAIAEGRLNGGFAVASPTEVFPEIFTRDYKAPDYCANGKFLRSRIFLGPEHTITSLHQDLFENLYIMTKGKKHITLFSPNSPVYPNSRFSKLPNHAQTDPEKPDYNKFPRMKLAQPYTVDLTAGESLYLPSFWWHHFRNLETSIGISFWWATGWKLPIAVAAAAYKKWREI